MKKVTVNNTNSVNNNKTQEVITMTRESNINNNAMVNNTNKKEENTMTREQFERESFDALVEQKAQEERKRQHEKEMNRFYKEAIFYDERRYLDLSKDAETKELEARRNADERLFEDTHFLDRDAEKCKMDTMVRNGYEESKDAFWDEHMNDIQKRACNLMALFTIDKDIAANNTFYRKEIKNVPDGFHDVEVAVTAFRAPGLVDAAFWAPRLRAMIDKIVDHQKHTQRVVNIQFAEIWAAFKAVVENYGIDNVPPVYKMLYTWYYDHATKEEKRDFEEYLPKAMNRFAWVYTTGKSNSKYPIYNVWRNIALGRNLNDAPDGVSPEFADKIRAYTDKAYALLFTEAREYSADELDDLEAKAMRYYREKFWEAKYLPKVGMDYNMLVKRASENEMAWKILDAFDDITDKDAAEYAARVIKSRQAEMAKIKAQEPLRKYAEALIDAMVDGLNDDQDYSKR